MIEEQNPLSEAEIKALFARGFNDPVFFCRHFLHEWFPLEMPWVHRGILAIVLRKTDFLLEYGDLDKIIANFVYHEDPQDESSPLIPMFQLEEDGSITLTVTKNTLLIMPRGFSKTTLMNAVIVIQIAYLLKKFPFYISESGPHAERQLANVKAIFEGNLRVQAVFGNIVPSRQDPAKWASDQIETTTKVVAMARGRGGQVRGSNIHAHRPDHLLIDDVEDEESVNTVEQREKTRKWFYEAVMPAIAELDPNATISALGTILHREALLMFLKRDPAWTCIVFGAQDRSGDWIWPIKHDAAKDAAKKASFALAGNLAGYYREYHSTLKDEATQKFKRRFFRYEPIARDDIVVKALAMDPALSQEKKKKTKASDFLALACVGMTAQGQIVVLGAEGFRGLLPRQQIDLFFEWHWKFGLTAMDHHGIEGNAFQVALVHLVREEMFRKKAYFEVVPIMNSASKIPRVEGVLQPRYSAGYIYHAERFALLEQQLEDWPNDKLDLPDAVAMAITMLDPHAANASPEDADLAADQYAPIERELGGTFRHAP